MRRSLSQIIPVSSGRCLGRGQGSAPIEGSSSFAWFSRYAGSLILTIAGSIVSALAGYVIWELPARLHSTSDATAKADLGPQNEAVNLTFRSQFNTLWDGALMTSL